jgi:acyl dehydratase
MALISDYKARLGQTLGVSRFVEIAQERIDEFARATGDFQFVHTDPARAAQETPFGGAIAHGFLILSLIGALAPEALPPAEEVQAIINMGVDKVRFLQPVPAGARVRARFRLDHFSQVGPARVALRVFVEMEMAGASRPVLTGEATFMAILREEAQKRAS